MSFDSQYSLHLVAMFVYMVMLAFYLLRSKRNAFGNELVSNPRLRREAGVLVLIYLLIYLVNIPIVLYFEENDARILSLTVDVLVCFPLVYRFLLMLLQDRRRWNNRLWWLALPVVFIVAIEMFTEWNGWIWLLFAFLAEGIFFILYYMKSVREYYHFLMNNYADLESKEVRWCMVFLLFFVFGDTFYILMYLQPDIEKMVIWSTLYHLADMVFISVIVWHVDKQQVLELSPSIDMDATVDKIKSSALDVNVNVNKVGRLLDQHCVAPALYLQHDLSLEKLAKACGTNRTYLGLYFSSMGINYHGYINGMRIQHFQQLYKDARKHPEDMPTLAQLATGCGFSSYDTFSRAFQASEGMSVSEWQKAKYPKD